MYKIIQLNLLIVLLMMYLMVVVSTSHPTGYPHGPTPGPTPGSTPGPTPGHTPGPTPGLAPGPVPSEGSVGGSGQGSRCIDVDYDGFIIIPSTVTIIEDKAFENCLQLNTLSFSSNSNLETIGFNAFKGTLNIFNIELPKSVIKIEESAFESSSIVSINSQG